MPDLDRPIDPSFDHPFIQEEHDDIMRKKVDLSHLDLNLQSQVYDLIREFWPVFDERGVFVPVKNYECDIDTGTARPIAVKNRLWQTRDSHHATLHLGLGKGRSHQANHGWKMVVQGIIRGQAPSRACSQH